LEILEWVEYIEKAYKDLDKKLPSAIRSNLFGRYDEITEMVDKEVLNGLEETITRYFLLKASRGETFGDVNKIKEAYGFAPEENYPYASLSFLRFAKTYWTYKIELTDIIVSHRGILATVILLEVERNIGSVFFPHPGPWVMWVRQRRETQRLLLETFAPDIDIKSFLNRNPLLGTSGGPIAQEVFNERIWATCLKRGCHKFFQIPNTVKALRVTCPFCRKSFRFPAKDYRWLNSIPPYSHFDKNKAEELERLRLKQHTHIGEFTTLVQCSNWCITRVLEFTLQQVRDQYPHASERELWKNVLKFRVESQRGGSSWNWLFSEKGYNDIIKEVSSFQDLCDYIITAERPISIYGVIEDVNDVLDEE
jgi:hypothetical protein